MKKIGWLILLVGLIASPTRGEVSWTEDYAAAAKSAADGGKYMLLNFTGSDWCGWCIRLDREVFTQTAYQEYAAENLISVKLDFPRSRELPEAVIAQNDALQEKYGVRGYPTILILSPSGDLVAQTGYRPGGPEAYVEHLKEIIARHGTAPPAP